MTEAEIPLLPKEELERGASTDASPVSRSATWSRALIAGIVGISLSIALHLGTSHQLSRHHEDPSACPATDAIPFKAPRTSESWLVFTELMGEMCGRIWTWPRRRP